MLYADWLMTSFLFGLSMESAALVFHLAFFSSSLHVRCAHLLPRDDEAFEHYNAFSAKRFEEVFHS